MGRKVHSRGGNMPETNGETSQGLLENALLKLVREVVRAEVQEIVNLKHHEDRLLTIDQAAKRLSDSKNWVYRNGRRLTFTKNSNQSSSLL
jgi:hypothetical protein